MVGGEGDDQLANFWRSGCGAGCHCSVLWLGGRVTTNFAGVDVVPLAEWMWCHCWVPLQGATVVCHGWGEGDDQLWRSGRGCHCCAVVVCYGGGG